MNGYRNTTELEQLWAIGGRRVRQVVGELEALGFELFVDTYGARKVPEELAQAVREVRGKGQPLGALRQHPLATRYLKTKAPADPLELALGIRADLTIIRGVVCELYRAVEQSNMTHRPGFVADWRNLGLPDPKNEL